MYDPHKGWLRRMLTFVVALGVIAWLLLWFGIQFKRMSDQMPDPKDVNFQTELKRRGT